MSPERVAVLVMSYGTPAAREEVEAYYTDVRRGRPPSPEQLADLVRRYDAIGGVSPLAERTAEQVAALEHALEELAPGRYEVFSGTKHGRPRIEEAVDSIAADGAHELVGVVLAPHYSAMSVGEYVARASEQAAGHGLACGFVRSWHDDPALVELLAGRLDTALETVGTPATREGAPRTAGPSWSSPPTASPPGCSRTVTPTPSSWRRLRRSWRSGAASTTPASPGRSAGRAPGGRPSRGSALTSSRCSATSPQPVRRASSSARRGSPPITSRCSTTSTSRRAPSPRALGSASPERPRSTTTNASPLCWRAPRARHHDGAGGRIVRAMTAPCAGRAVVAGGGISGLVAALELARLGHDVTLLEGSSRLGGKLTTTTWRGRPLDLGPDAFIARNPAAAELCREVGLGEDLIAPATGTAAIWARGRLRAFPAGLALGVPVDLPALARSGIVGAGGVARAALDLVLPGPDLAELVGHAAEGGADPTIAEVVTPRLGRQVLANLVDPLLGGINAGDSHNLSFAAAAPMLASRLGHHASLIRSLRPGAPPRRRHGAGSAQPPAPAPVFLGLRQGMSSLVGALAARCVEAGVTVRLESPVVQVRRAPAAPGYLVELSGGGQPLVADRLVLAVPAPAAAAALRQLDDRLAAELAAIAYAGVVLVTAAFDAGELSKPPSGSGVLVPRSGSKHVTALTFVSSKWPRSAAAGELVVRASLGRYGAEGVLDLDDAGAGALALGEIGAVLGLRAEPLDVLVRRWPASFPQYVSGHLARVRRIEQLTSAHLGLALAGAAYRGIGIPACIEDGRRAAGLVNAAPLPGTVAPPLR